MKRGFKLAVAIMTLIELICLCIPSSIEEITYIKATIGYRRAYSNSRNIFGVWADGGKILGVLLAILLFLSIAVFLLDYLQKKRLFEFAPWLTFISAIILGFFGYFTSELADFHDATYSYSWNLGWLFYVAILLHAVCVLLALLIRFQKDDVSKTSE